MLKIKIAIDWRFAFGDSLELSQRHLRQAALLVKPCGDRLVDHFAGVDGAAGFLLPIHIGT